VGDRSATGSTRQAGGLIGRSIVLPPPRLAVKRIHASHESGDLEFA
jgi:hypothetical protein